VLSQLPLSEPAGNLSAIGFVLSSLTITHDDGATRSPKLTARRYWNHKRAVVDTGSASKYVDTAHFETQNSYPGPRRHSVATIDADPSRAWALRPTGLALPSVASGRAAAKYRPQSGEGEQPCIPKTEPAAAAWLFSFWKSIPACIHLKKT